MQELSHRHTSYDEEHSQSADIHKMYVGMVASGFKLESFGEKFKLV